MVVGEDGVVALPWLAQPLEDALSQHRGHALLIQGSDGVGMLPFALTLAQAWLCEAPQTGRPKGLRGPCGRCGSCHLVQSHLHPDLQVLMPELLRRQHAWLRLDDKPEGDDKRKPSKQIRIDEVRSVIDWVFRTSARGRGKVVVMHPAEALNPQSANALLKTLEEPPPGTRIVLTCGDPALLLATVRSRCQHLRLAAPSQAVGTAWLADHGVDQPEVLLAACGGRPLDALGLFQAGVLAQHWRALPASVARGQPGVLQGWPLPRVLEALQKLCHDAMALVNGAQPHYFPAGSIGAGASMPLLAEWAGELRRISRNDEHPWNEGLMLDALLASASRALRTSAPTPTAARRGLDTLAP